MCPNFVGMSNLLSLLSLLLLAVCVRWQHWNGHVSQESQWLQVVQFSLTRPPLYENNFCRLSVQPSTGASVLQVPKEPVLILPQVLQTHSFYEGVPRHMEIIGWSYWGVTKNVILTGDVAACVYDSMQSYLEGFHLPLSHSIDL